MGVVIDTNVAVVSSRLSPQADERCVTACINRLREVQQTGKLLLDDKGLILHEYTKNLGFAGQPGAGHAFVKWAHDHQAIPAKIRKVAITPTSDGSWRRYEQFPDCHNLSTFDKSDQKFVAVAVASGNSPPILVAIDRGWWNCRMALTAAGINVEHLCPQHAPPAGGTTRP